MKTAKHKSEDNPDMKVLKTSSCKTLSGKSTLTYQLGCLPDSAIHLRITKNSGGGFFSDEWVSLDDILRLLKDLPGNSPIMSHFISPLLKGKSVNTSAFILAALTHLKLIQALPKKQRLHELSDPQPFLDTVEKLMTTSTVKTVKKTSRTATSKKAAVKTRATAKRTKATTSTKKASSAQR